MNVNPGTRDYRLVGRASAAAVANCLAAAEVRIVDGRVMIEIGRDI